MSSNPNITPAPHGVTGVVVNEPATISIGEHRLLKDRRQYGSLLFVLSLAALLYPLNNLAYRVGRDGTSANKGIPLISLISSVFIAFIGMVGMIVGYLSAIHDYGSRVLSACLIAVVQLAWLPYIADMAKTARDADELIHPAYRSDDRDNNVVAAMGVLGIFGYAVFFMGSIGFLAFGLYGYHAQSHKFHTQSYYRSRFFVYSFFTFVAGFSQLFLGAYIRAEFTVEDGALLIPIATGPYFIMLPGIAIFIGAANVAMAALCIWRGVVIKGRDDHMIQYAYLLLWILATILQVVVQFSYPEGALGAPSTPSVAALLVAFHAFPAFLEYRMRTAPVEISEGYYSAAPAEEPNKARENDSMSDEELDA